MTLHKFLKSNTFAVIIAILSVVVQSFHSYVAFYNTSSLKGSVWGIGQAVLFSIVLDLSILFYTLRNKTAVALGFSVAMVVINSYYYYQHLGLSFQFAFGVFLSLIIPISVYFYSEEIKDEETPDRENPFMLAELDSAIRVRDHIQVEYEKLQKQHANLRKMYSEINRTPPDTSLLGVDTDHINEVEYEEEVLGTPKIKWPPTDTSKPSAEF